MWDPRGIAFHSDDSRARSRAHGSVVGGVTVGFAEKASGYLT